MFKPHVDITGQKFNRLYVVREVGKDNNGHYLWECRCDCGNTTILQTHSITSGSTKSCGCYSRDCARKLMTRHGMTDTRLYQTWCNIKNRCFNPNTDMYYLYGGRGIIMCDEWRYSFDNFLAWAKDTGYTDELTIDRIDVNGNYEPSNCKWSTKIEQANNKRSNHRLTYKGETKTVAEWARVCGISAQNIYKRLRIGWTVERALETPVGDDKWHRTQQKRTSA